jgi:hypothetical protein
LRVAPKKKRRLIQGIRRFFVAARLGEDLGRLKTIRAHFNF